MKDIFLRENLEDREVRHLVPKELGVVENKNEVKGCKENIILASNKIKTV